ncbi:hypothetical protein KP509_04G036000 [Ceratopteris richardii]|uniref:Uncharacterized protein n=1 Tax=Ceratopteris richardii TaxID=49495 RepID=A0A8T2UZK2_CERRI|nr:hypothetical protein KP509_04G036000 [Ceratopteris richardii]
MLDLVRCTSVIRVAGKGFHATRELRSARFRVRSPQLISECVSWRVKGRSSWQQAARRKLSFVISTLGPIRGLGNNSCQLVPRTRTCGTGRFYVPRKRSCPDSRSRDLFSDQLYLPFQQNIQVFVNI